MYGNIENKKLVTNSISTVSSRILTADEGQYLTLFISSPHCLTLLGKDGLDDLVQLLNKNLGKPFIKGILISVTH